MTQRIVSRLLANVGPITGERRTAHTWRGADGNESLMPLPDVLLLEATDDAGVMLFRWTSSGDFGGDTWHESLEDAKHQAEYEYGSSLGNWVEVPEDVKDANEYAIQFAQSSVRDA